jgi:hypothetical protein
MTQVLPRVPVHPLLRLPAMAAPLAVGAVAAASCVVVALVDPSQPGRYPLCPFYAVTGRWCPGCGSLRGLHQLLNGNVGAALGFNPLMVLAAPILVYSWLAWLSRSVAAGPTLPRFGTGARTPLVVLVVVLAFWLLRNLAWAPFTALAP